MNENERSALAAYRSSLGAKQPEPGRDWSRLLSKIEAGTQPMSVELEPPSRRRWIAWSLGAVAAVALAVWAWPRPEAAQGESTADASQAAYGAEERAPSGVANTQRDPVQPMNPQPRSVPQPPVTDDEVVPEPVRGELSARTAEPVKRSKKAPPSGAEPESAADVPKPGGVVEEAKALRTVRALIRDRKADEALRLLRRYFSRFPTGELRDEATLLRADALCMDGQREMARGVASGFVRAHPKSPLTARAQDVCREP